MASPTPQPVPIDNTYALKLKALHQPSSPFVLSNVHDIPSTTTVLALNTPTSTPVRALATGSYAIAGTLGLADADLTLPLNLQALSLISPIARAAGVPLSADLQDGYGEQLRECVGGAIDLGVVGANIEDGIPERGYGRGLDGLRTLEEQVERLKVVFEIAKEKGLPNFVVNARTDLFMLNPRPEGWGHEDMLKEALKRGKAYLEAGATSFFVWGPELTVEDVRTLVRGLDGKVAVLLSGGGGKVTVAEWKEIGVCRISVGPTLWRESMDALKKAAEKILGLE
ncbi:hypothetical protein VC83_06967 [Pseudogymnoascus destructans]|uniref:Uncharacterized protein n=2 Tax=Pseudogymnoascus destructans TaxID=655981 RepID=L8FNM3_PSED2|nr:uncharacterized protein VC83_06967 [Pseudogymnoascus destructans]ELR02129.1 hypothetical protein GMDG_05288 [Pseudogymnoascus destructans 20631-21]OAF56935.1 hypothetical protein VC83_06967 [Pseudogymnoascus destructans]